MQFSNEQTSEVAQASIRFIHLFKRGFLYILANCDFSVWLSQYYKLKLDKDGAGLFVVNKIVQFSYAVSAHPALNILCSSTSYSRIPFTIQTHAAH
jgi:hypothetical protein